MLTNAANLPDALYRAIANDPYTPGDCDISVTTLIGPPQIRVLKKKHGHEVEEDVLDRIWSLLGQSVHVILERANQNDIAEKRLYMDAMGWRIGGQFDNLAFKDGILSDYKVTSVWSAKNGGKDEWEQQLNVLRVICDVNGFKVNKLQIVGIYRDWSKNEALKGDGYPKHQSSVIPVKLWDMDKAIGYIKERVQIHQEAEKGNVTPCTLKERWHRGGCWAVMKKGRKSALRLLPTEEQAKEWAEKNCKDAEIVHRPGQFTRCEQYCSVNKFCPTWTGH